MWSQTTAKGSTLSDVTAGLLLHPPDGKTEAPAAERRADLGTWAAGCSPRPVLVAVPHGPDPLDSQVSNAQRQASTH